MNTSFQSLMQKEMTRKEFLSVIGVIIASIFGLTTVIKLLGLKSHLQPQTNIDARAYGK